MAQHFYEKKNWKTGSSTFFQKSEWNEPSLQGKQLSVCIVSDESQVFVWKL